MAQTATMGPPLSPRETRRSGRRSAPSASTSTSKSPQPESASQPKEKPSRPVLSTSNSNGRNRRFKQEDVEGSVEDHKSTRQANTNGRSKRKGKEKEKQPATADVVSESAIFKTKSSVSNEEHSAEVVEEEQGITRCLCGSAGEDDPDAGEFMVQCETCKVWQHGLCMGYESEDQLHDDDYYCEQCRPELHQELFRKRSKKARHSSANSHHNPITATSRVSRSHSPSHSSKPAKRRNTMNSRDAAFDESLKEIIEATAAEAAAAHDSRSVVSNGNTNGPPEPDEDVAPNIRKKRKRPDEDVVPKKRNRSASSVSDTHIGSALPRGETPVPGTGNRTALVSNPTPKNKSGRNKRGGGRKTVVHEPPPPEGIEVTQPIKRQAQSSRAKALNPLKRPPPSTASHAPGGAAHEHGTRRNHPNGSNGPGMHASTSAETSRAYRNSHAYAVSQQPLFTSWNLPDYLAHLEPMLPTETPRPLEVRGFGAGVGGRESMETTIERGVKVKWPSKRMSVGDMNKRVRALVEWVGREQASALDRGRRREALEKALKDTTKGREKNAGAGGSVEANSPKIADEACGDKSNPPIAPVVPASALQDKNPLGSISTNVDGGFRDTVLRPSTMKVMEDLMEELIGFQERFGPGSKIRERERRFAGT